MRACGARTIADLGCGDGDLLLRLAVEPRIERIVGLDLCPDALARLRARLARVRLARAGAAPAARVELMQGSMTEHHPALAGVDCAVLIETIEHIAPDRLSTLEHAVFARLHPETVIVTTPNAEFNALLGVPSHRFRHPGHRFEWDRAKFARWAAGVAARHGYAVARHDIAGRHSLLGGASQMAVFRQTPGAPPAGLSPAPAED